MVRLVTFGSVGPAMLPGEEPGSIWMMSPLFRPLVDKAACKVAKLVTLSARAAATTKRVLGTVRSSSASSQGWAEGLRGEGRAGWA